MGQIIDTDGLALYDQEYVIPLIGSELGPVSKIIGDTSVTFTNSIIQTTSHLSLWSDNSTNAPIYWSGVTVASGTVTYTFSALTVNTDFYLQVVNETYTPS